MTLMTRFQIFLDFWIFSYYWLLLNYYHMIQILVAPIDLKKDNQWITDEVFREKLMF